MGQYEVFRWTTTAACFKNVQSRRSVYASSCAQTLHANVGMKTKDAYSYSKYTQKRVIRVITRKEFYTHVNYTNTTRIVHEFYTRVTHISHACE